MVSPLYIYITVIYLVLRMSRKDKQVNVRIPHQLVEELKRNATESKRSLTAQLNFIIEEWLKDQSQINK
jgi:hypothetical protein